MARVLSERIVDRALDLNSRPLLQFQPGIFEKMLVFQNNVSRRNPGQPNFWAKRTAKQAGTGSGPSPGFFRYLSMPDRARNERSTHSMLPLPLIPFGTSLGHTRQDLIISNEGSSEASNSSDSMTARCMQLKNPRLFNSR